MNSIVLCEGFDDSYVLGYYLYKTDGWFLTPDQRISDRFDLPRVPKRNQRIEVYKKDDDNLVIWCVGGKDNFGSAFEYIGRVQKMAPEDSFINIFILADRDDTEIEECISLIIQNADSHGISVGKLINSSNNSFSYEAEGELYRFNIIPIVIPFDRNGALETVLMDGIKKLGEEEEYIVAEAGKYIKGVIYSGILKKYLQKQRLRTKAEFSAVISVTNPDRSTAEFNTLLTSLEWEKLPEINKHFEIIREILSRN